MQILASLIKKLILKSFAALIRNRKTSISEALCGVDNKQKKILENIASLIKKQKFNSGALCGVDKNQKKSNSAAIFGVGKKSKRSNSAALCGVDKKPKKKQFL